MNIKKVYNLPIGANNIDSISNNADVLYYKKDNTNNKFYWWINDKKTNIEAAAAQDEISESDNSKIKRRSNFISSLELANNDLKDGFGILEQRLNNIRQDLTYWDVYHIKTQVSDNDDIDTVFSSLEPGESLVYNSKFLKTYTISDKTAYTLKKGDVVVKTIDGDAIVVQTLSPGIYYPESITQDTNGYNISYTYSVAMPSVDEPVELTIGQSVDPADGIPKKITFKQAHDLLNKQPYNLSLEIPGATAAEPGVVKFDIIFYKEKAQDASEAKKTIIPVIKIYNSKNEEVYADFTLTTLPAGNNPTQWCFTTACYDLGTDVYHILVK